MVKTKNTPKLKEKRILSNNVRKTTAAIIVTAFIV